MLLALLMCYAGFTALCLSTDRHHGELLHSKPSPRRRIALRVIGWLLLTHAETALAAIDRDPSNSDIAFYRGKVAAATFFAKNVLPRLSAERQIVEASDLFVMEIGEESF